MIAPVWLSFALTPFVIFNLFVHYPEISARSVTSFARWQIIPGYSSSLHSIQYLGAAQVSKLPRFQPPLSPGRPVSSSNSGSEMTPVSGSSNSGKEVTNQANSPRDYGQVANRRYDVDKEPILKLHLQDWEDEKKQQLLSVESYRGRCNAAKTELYQLMGFYSVFLGVVFTAVSTASKLTCQTSFFPAVLSGLASIATAVSVHYKLDYYRTQKLKFLRAQDETENIIAKIRKLKGNGRGFKFALLDDSGVQKAELEVKLKAERKSRRVIWWVVMLFLTIFTLMIVASCIIVLCWDPDQHKLKGCTFHNLCWGEKGNATTAG